MIKRKRLIMVLIICMMAAFIPQVVGAHMETAGDITKTGVDFLTNPPQEEISYTAGNGTVTYTPGNNGNNAKITLNNATINGSMRIIYQSPNSASAALFATGNIDLVLIGQNNITVTKNGCQGLFFYHSNVTVKGTGSLTIDTTAIDTYGLSPFSILGSNYDTPEETGNFTLESGSLTIKVKQRESARCLSAPKDIIIKGGTLEIEGSNYSIESVSGDIVISGGTVICRDFAAKGISSYNGDIIISGNDTSVTLTSLDKDKYSMGIYTERELKDDMTGGCVFIEGGNINVSAGQCGIYTHLGGTISISGGTVTAEADNQTGDGIAVGIYSKGKIDITGGRVNAIGKGAENVQRYGIYSDESISVSGGDATFIGIDGAITSIPDVSGCENAVITAATDFEGNNIQEYNENNIEDYKYLNIKNNEYSIDFVDGITVINAVEDINAVVIFASYDSAGILSDVEIKQVDLVKGNNSIIPDSFSFEQGKTVKIMLLSEMDNINPLCSAKTVYAVK